MVGWRELDLCGWMEEVDLCGGMEEGRPLW